jgi:hypothetical protein
MQEMRDLIMITSLLIKDGSMHRKNIEARKTHYSKIKYNGFQNTADELFSLLAQKIEKVSGWRAELEELKHSNQSKFVLIDNNLESLEIHRRGEMLPEIVEKLNAKMEAKASARRSIS